MSKPRTLAFSDDIVRTDVATARGTYAAFTCSPQHSSLPRGSALLIPGFTGSKEDFAALLPQLADAGWSVATYDQRGQYETPAAAGADLTLAGFAADASAVSAELFGTSERVHLVGHSFGGLVAATAAIGKPELWASLVLLCSGPGGFEGSRRDEPLAAVAALERDGLDSVYRAMQQRDHAAGLPRPSPDIEDFLHRRFLANSVASLTAVGRHLTAAPDLTSALAGLDLPVRVVRGERDDAWPHDVQDRLAAALGTSVVVIPGAGHSPAWEAPEETRDALIRQWMS